MIGLQYAITWLSVRSRRVENLMLHDRDRPRLHRVLRAFDELPRDARDGLTIDVDAMTIL